MAILLHRLGSPQDVAAFARKLDDVPTVHLDRDRRRGALVSSQQLRNAN